MFALFVINLNLKVDFTLKFSQKVKMYEFFSQKINLEEILVQFSVFDCFKVTLHVLY